MKTILENELNNFKLAHYQNADFDSLAYETFHLYNKFNKLKSKKKLNYTILKIYTLYLQLTEILFINANALSVSLDRFPSALFITSPDLQRFIKDNFSKDTKFSNWFLLNPVFALMKQDKDFKEKFNLYSNLLREVADDYLKNYDLLNAYKHGYRINAKHEKSTLSLGINKNESFVLAETDSTIIYFSKGKVNDDITVFEHTLNFNVERIFVKCTFVCALLNNIRVTILRYYKKKTPGQKILRFSINDKPGWSKTFGGSHMKKPIFSLHGNE